MIETVSFITSESYYVSFIRTESLALAKPDLLTLLEEIFYKTESVLQPLSITAIRNYTHEGFPYNDWNIEEKNLHHTLKQKDASIFNDADNNTINFSIEKMDTGTIVSWLDGLLVQDVPGRMASFLIIKINASAVRVFADTVRMYKADKKDVPAPGLLCIDDEYWVQGPSKYFEYCPVAWHLHHDAEIYSLTFSINYSPYLNKKLEEYKELKKCFHSLAALGWKADSDNELFELKK